MLQLYRITRYFNRISSYLYLANIFISFMKGGRYHIETSPLICSENQWTGFYMIRVFVMKELRI